MALLVKRRAFFRGLALSIRTHHASGGMTGEPSVSEIVPPLAWWVRVGRKPENQSATDHYDTFAGSTTITCPCQYSRFCTASAVSL